MRFWIWIAKTSAGCRSNMGRVIVSRYIRDLSRKEVEKAAWMACCCDFFLVFLEEEVNYSTTFLVLQLFDREICQSSRKT